MPDPIGTHEQIEAFADAVRDLKAAADRLDVKITAIGFASAHQRNKIAEQLANLKIAGTPWFEENVRIVDHGNVTICGVHLVVQWR